MTDFAKISLATDRVRASKKPETRDIGHLITVSVVLGALMVAEAQFHTRFLVWFARVWDTIDKVRYLAPYPATSLPCPLTSHENLTQ